MNRRWLLFQISYCGPFEVFIFHVLVRFPDPFHKLKFARLGIFLFVERTSFKMLTSRKLDLRSQNLPWLLAIFSTTLMHPWLEWTISGLLKFMSWFILTTANTNWLRATGNKANSDFIFWVYAIVQYDQSADGFWDPGGIILIRIHATHSISEFFKRHIFQRISWYRWVRNGVIFLVYSNHL